MRLCVGQFECWLPSHLLQMVSDSDAESKSSKLTKRTKAVEDADMKKASVVEILVGRV